jgi:acyl-coenzyme A synthetase/AMP-(fatty) acid ligase
MVASGSLTKDGFYRTGDLGHLDERGFLHYTSRASDMIKTSGINVAPAEVEEFLSRLDGVAEVAVVGAPDPQRDEIVVAYVVSQNGVELDEAELLERCRGRLASYKIPARIVIVDALPKTDTGKLQRTSLRALARDLPERVTRA